MDNIKLLMTDIKLLAQKSKSLCFIFIAYYSNVLFNGIVPILDLHYQRIIIRQLIKDLYCHH